MGNLGWTEILIILGIALIIFGPRKLPQIGKTIGDSLAQFRRASEDFKRTWEMEVEEDDRRKTVKPHTESLPPSEMYSEPEDFPVIPEEEVATSSDEVVSEVQTLPDEQIVTEKEPAIAETK